MCFTKVNRYGIIKPQKREKKSEMITLTLSDIAIIAIAFIIYNIVIINGVTMGIRRKYTGFFSKKRAESYLRARDDKYFTM